MQLNISLRLCLLTGLLLSALIYYWHSHESEIQSTPVSEESLEPFRKVLEEYTRTDVGSLISIHNSAGVLKKRQQLVDILWGEEGVPSSMPFSVKREWGDERYDTVRSLQRIDLLHVKMDFGLDSFVYHFVPKDPIEKVVFFHQGHRGDFVQNIEIIEKLIDAGYSVFGFSMPLTGFNNQPSVNIPHLGEIKLTSHDQLKLLPTIDGSPIKYLIEPVIVTLNYVKKHIGHTHLSMLGISGGGWTATLAAAADQRIERSFSIAGSYPLYLRSNSQRDWGDYEQTSPEIYASVNYLELYVLAGVGENRKHLQIINQYDTCCFAGIKWNTYKEAVKTKVQELGSGGYDLFMDSSHKSHKISKIVMEKILMDLE